MLRISFSFTRCKDDVQRILSQPHDDDAADSLVAVFFQRVPAKCRPHLHDRHVFQPYRHAASRGLNGIVFQFPNRRRPTVEPADAAQNVFAIARQQNLPADIEITRRDRGKYRRHRHVEGTQLRRIDIDVIFAFKSADAGDLCHAWNRRRCVAHVEILHRPQLIEARAVPFDRVPEDLPERRRVRRASCGMTPLGNCACAAISLSSTRWRAKYGSMRSSKMTLINEKPKSLPARTVFHARKPLQLHAQRIGHLLFHLQRRATDQSA